MNKQLVVCASCLTACCWQGLFFCQDYLTANIKTITVEEAKRLGYEHDDYIERFAGAA